jgi:hypothetical protein
MKRFPRSRETASLSINVGGLVAVDCLWASQVNWGNSKVWGFGKISSRETVSRMKCLELRELSIHSRGG